MEPPEAGVESVTWAELTSTTVSSAKSRDSRIGSVSVCAARTADGTSAPTPVSTARAAGTDEPRSRTANIFCLHERTFSMEPLRKKGTVRRAQSTLSSMLERSSPDPFPEDGIAPRAKRFRFTRSFHENQTERTPAFRIPKGKRTPGRLLPRAPFSLLKARPLLGLLVRIFRRPQEKTV